MPSNALNRKFANNKDSALFPPAESQAGLGGVRVCRMGDTEQCRELALGWVVDTDNKQQMAVRTGDGWRKILVMNIIIMVTIMILSSFSLETRYPGRTSRTSGIRRRMGTSRMTDRGHVVTRSPGSRRASSPPSRSPATATTATAGATTTPRPSRTSPRPLGPATGAW